MLTPLKCPFCNTVLREPSDERSDGASHWRSYRCRVCDKRLDSVEILVPEIEKAVAGLTQALMMFSRPEIALNIGGEWERGKLIGEKVEMHVVMEDGTHTLNGSVAVILREVIEFREDIHVPEDSLYTSISTVIAAYHLPVEVLAHAFQNEYGEWQNRLMPSGRMLRGKRYGDPLNKRYGQVWFTVQKVFEDDTRRPELETPEEQRGVARRLIDAGLGVLDRDPQRAAQYFASSVVFLRQAEEKESA